jgi:hypothetical protein
MEYSLPTIPEGNLCHNATDKTDDPSLCLSCGTSLERIAPESLTRWASNLFTAISRGNAKKHYKIE